MLQTPLPPRILPPIILLERSCVVKLPPPPVRRSRVDATRARLDVDVCLGYRGLPSACLSPSQVAPSIECALRQLNSTKIPGLGGKCTLGTRL